MTECVSSNGTVSSCKILDTCHIGIIPMVNISALVEFLQGKLIVQTTFDVLHLLVDNMKNFIKWAYAVTYIIIMTVEQFHHGH